MDSKKKKDKRRCVNLRGEKTLCTLLAVIKMKKKTEKEKK